MEQAQPGEKRGGAGPRVLLVSAADRWVFQNLVPSLRRTCSRVDAYPLGDSMGNWHLPDWPALRKRLMARFLSDVRSIVNGPGLDLVVTVLYDDTLRPEDVRALRDMGVRVVTYHVDMNMQWYRVLLHAPVLDLLAVSHMQNLEPLVRRGTPLHFMPMAASPDRYLVDPDAAVPAPGVLMLGSVTDHRVRAVAACTEVTEEVDVYGGGWKSILGEQKPESASAGAHVVQPLAKRVFDLRHYLAPRLMAEGRNVVGRLREQAVPLDEATKRRAARARVRGFASDEAVPSLLAKARVTLGVNQRTGQIGDRFGVADSRLRDFEAPLSGAFYLVQNFVDLPLFYRTGREVETWSTLDEMKEKVRWFLDHEGERRAIASAGRERARRDHTWDARLADLFHRLSLPFREGGEAAPLRVVANLSSSAWCAESPGCVPEGDAKGPAPELPAMIKRGV